MPEEEVFVQIPETSKGVKSDGFYGKPGERIKVPKSVRDKWCAYGWAEDPTGEVATGQRDERGSSRLDIHNVTQQQTARRAGR